MARSHENYSNETIYGIESSALRYAWAGYFLFVLLSSLIGDTTILIASIKCRAIKLHKVIVVIIQHIAFCDLMVLATDALPRIVSVLRRKWEFGKFFCYLLTHVRHYFYQNNIFLLCCMTSSKLILLKYSLRFGSISTKKAHVYCMAFWLAALILPLAPILVDVLDGQDIFFSHRAYICCYAYTSDIWNWLRPSLAVFYMLIPNCVVVATTVDLLTIAKKVTQRGRDSLKWQGILTTVLTATVYFISFLPYPVSSVGEAIITVDDQSGSLFHTTFYRISTSLLFLNTISNFYIYNLSVYSFRDFIFSRVQRAYEMVRFSISTSGILGSVKCLCVLPLVSELYFKRSKVPFEVLHFCP